MTELLTRPAQRPVVLCILDGWGHRPDRNDNAVAQANTPNWDAFVASAPSAYLDASALEVGLPTGQMGNSEVGHMNLGAGRVVMQDLPRIDAAIADGSLAANPELLAFIDTLKKSGGACHIMGLMSPGGVHSMQSQMAALARRVGQAGVPVIVHSYLDGRDTPPSSAAGFMANFVADTKDIPNLSFGVVSGRYYVMDRDNRWERVVKAYDALVGAKAEGGSGPDPVSIIKASYAKGVTDEFVLPAVVDGYAGMKDGDGILMGNFRADRAREILAAFADPDFDGFERSRVIDFAARLGLVEYSTHLNAFYKVLFPSLPLTNILGEIVSRAGLKQLRIAETEKYAHVTFFLNGGREAVYDGEDRILIASPKVATYDLQPEMSAPEVCDKLVEAVGSDTYDLVIVNFANGDMVGHTGILSAAIKAAETVDAAIGRLGAAVEAAGGSLLMTADHGNCEKMYDRENDEPHTAHTLNQVPVVLLSAPDGVQGLKNGRLADVAPTILSLMGLEQPSDMTGVSLIDWR